MQSTDFVIIGVADVDRAVRLARRVGWSARPAPRDLVSRLGGGRCEQLGSAGAPLGVVLTRSRTLLRATGWWDADRVAALDRRPERLLAALRSCPAAEALVAALAASGRSRVA